MAVGGDAVDIGYGWTTVSALARERGVSSAGVSKPVLGAASTSHTDGLQANNRCFKIGTITLLLKYIQSA